MLYGTYTGPIFRWHCQSNLDLFLELPRLCFYIYVNTVLSFHTETISFVTDILVKEISLDSTLC